MLAPPDRLVQGGSAGRLEWLEMSTREDASLMPVAQKAVGQWEQVGFAVRSHLVQGPSFWQTTEIEDAPGLIAATMGAIAPFSMHQAVPA